MQSIKSTHCEYYDFCDYTAMCVICKNYKYYYMSKHYKDSKKQYGKMHGNMKSQKWNKKEQEYQENLNAEQTLLSGRINGDGDIKNDDLIMEVKYTDHNNITISSDFIKQIEKEKGHRYGLLGLSNGKYSIILFEYNDNMNFKFNFILDINKQKTINTKMLKRLFFDKEIGLINILSLQKKYVIIDQNNFYELGGITWVKNL